MFRTVPLSIVRSFHCTHSNSICHTGLLTACEQDQDETAVTCFGQFLCPSSGVFHCTHSNGICHTGLLTACEQDQDEATVTCFGQFLCPSPGVFHCTDSNGICHTGLLTACEQDQDAVRPYPARSASNTNEYQEYFLGGKGDRCLGLTT